MFENGIKEIYHLLKKNRITSGILKIFDIVIPRHLKEHHHQLYVRLVSNHWVKSSYEKEIREVFKKVCKSKSLRTLYDIGANVGIFSLDFLSINPTNFVYAFEPNQDVFLCLKKTKEKNNLESFHIFDLAISNRCGFAKLTYDPLSPAKGGLNPIINGKYNHELEYNGFSVSSEVKIETLDSLCSKYKPPDVIKIDAEGEELSILKGAETTFSKYRPIVFFECSKERDEIKEFLLRHRYEFKNLRLETISNLDGFNIAFPK